VPVGDSIFSVAESFSLSYEDTNFINLHAAPASIVYIFIKNIK